MGYQRRSSKKQIQNKGGNMTKFRTNYNAKVIKSIPSDKTKMTVPGQALTNSQHMAKAKQGLSDQTVKMIYDPNNAYPDISALDLVDRRKMLQGARALVNDLKEKRANHEKVYQEIQTKKAEDKQLADDKRVQDLIEQNKLKSVKGGL